LPSASIRDTWRGIRTPPDDATLAATPVARSNAWVFKTHRGGFGLLLAGVDPPRAMPPLRNIEVSFKPEKLVHQGGKGSSLLNCLEVRLSPECDADTLASIVDRLGEKEPSGSFSTQNLIDIIRDVIEVVKPPAPQPSLDDVIGAWGELHILGNLISRATSAERQTSILLGWESQRAARDIIDFRFRHADVAIEVKTSSGERIHHIRGFDQVKVPDGFSNGFLASLLVTRSAERAGMTCSDLVQSLRMTSIGSDNDKAAFARLLDDKVDSRGREARDEAYSFHPREHSTLLFTFEQVPRPAPAPLVSEVQWTADLRNGRPLTDTETDAVIQGIIR
jgi:hypothetical protein